METIQGSEPRMRVPGKPYPVTLLGYPAEMIGPNETYANVSDQIAGIPLKHPHQKLWFAGFTIAFAFVPVVLRGGGLPALSRRGHLGHQYSGRLGICDYQFRLVDRDWPRGHFHFRHSACCCIQKWRTTINRFTEAMTLFAVMCAGMFPLLHLGRPWVFYWLLPYPDTMALWPQFRSPLVWDVFAVSTYFTVSLMFWYHRRDARPGDGARQGRKPNGNKSFTAWARWAGAVRRGIGNGINRLTCLLGGLATPLVLSVHSVVSFDFAVAQLPGWHSTIFPPYFVAGAIYSGFAMVLNLMIPDSPHLRIAKSDHDPDAEQHGLRDAGHRLDGDLRLHHGGVHGLVQRRCFRTST